MARGYSCATPRPGRAGKKTGGITSLFWRSKRGHGPQMNSGRWVALCLLLVLTSGCVSVADFERVRREQKEMQARLADTQATVDSLKQRVDSMRTSVDE